MIHACGGSAADGRSVLVLGLTAEECVALAAGQVLTIDLQTILPTLPGMHLLLLGGRTDQALLDDIEATVPGVWRLDRVDGTGPG